MGSAAHGTQGRAMVRVRARANTEGADRRKAEDRARQQGASGVDQRIQQAEKGRVADPQEADSRIAGEGRQPGTESPVHVAGRSFVATRMVRQFAFTTIL